MPVVRGFSGLDLKAALGKSAYRRKLPRLRERIRDLQQAVRVAGMPVIVVFEGWDASGKGDSIGTLTYPMDPRGFRVFTTQEPNDEERLRPFLWRFSTRLPRRGDFVFFDRSWYRRLLEERLNHDLRRRDVPLVAAEIRDFESGLIDDGAVLVKFWLHISKKEQARRFETMESDRYERWRVTKEDWRRHQNYASYERAAARMIELTDTPQAPWHPIAATDQEYRRIRVFETLIAVVDRALKARGVGRRPGTRAPKSDGSDARARAEGERVRVTVKTPVLDRVDLTRRLTRAKYETLLDPLQERMRDLGLECFRRRLPVVIVYEGWDAAGKGGNIKRLTQEVDPRGYDVISIAAPDETEKAHHYLWRFWRQLPKAGHIAIFDRSWYGRVLVERVEGFASEAEWSRAYQEINAFERCLTDSGAVVIKFWLHLSPEEQLRRFKERETTSYKRYKITGEDWRNRAKWNQYKQAVEEMIERTSPELAPWTIVEAEDKLWARVRTLTAVVEAIGKRLDGKDSKGPRGLG